jgi:hypothetical protein
MVDDRRGPATMQFSRSIHLPHVQLSDFDGMTLAANRLGPDVPLPVWGFVNRARSGRPAAFVIL